jgi:GNAT superfamily N-acetyltransferase
METIVRPAKPEDIEALGRMAAALTRMHHAMDPDRFLIVEPLEGGYGRWLGREAQREGALVLVAEREGAIAGYVYATLEPRDWMALRDACGVIQDIFVTEATRRSSLARQLMEAATQWMKEHNAPRVVLSTAARNPGAQAFFEAMGFRATMIELTRGLAK